MAAPDRKKALAKSRAVKDRIRKETGIRRVLDEGPNASGGAKPVTRLKTSDVFDIGAGLQAYDEYLKAQTGRTLRGIACHAGKIDPKTVAGRIAATHIGIIPMTCGQGLISGFSDAVAGFAPIWDLIPLSQHIRMPPAWPKPLKKSRHRHAGR